MKPSRRAKRMTRKHHRRKRSGATLMLVSLMDIFTILVFFLLVNTSTETDPFPDLPYLPDSTAQQAGQRTVKIVANASSIQVDQQIIVRDIEAWLATPPYQADGSINPNEPLTAALSESRQQLPTATNADEEDQTTALAIVTLLADKNLPYAVIDRITLSARDAGFDRLAHGTKKQPITINQPPLSAESLLNGSNGSPTQSGAGE